MCERYEKQNIESVSKIEMELLVDYNKTLSKQVTNEKKNARKQKDDPWILESNAQQCIHICMYMSAISNRRDDATDTITTKITVRFWIAIKACRRIEWLGELRARAEAKGYEWGA